MFIVELNCSNRFEPYIKILYTFQTLEEAINLKDQYEEWDEDDSDCGWQYIRILENDEIIYCPEWAKEEEDDE